MTEQKELTYQEHIEKAIEILQELKTQRTNERNKRKRTSRLHL